MTNNETRDLASRETTDPTTNMERQGEALAVEQRHRDAARRYFGRPLDIHPHAEVDEAAKHFAQFERTLATPNEPVGDREALARDIARVAGCQVGSDRTRKIVDYILALAKPSNPSGLQGAEAASIRERSEITNELGNSIAFEIYSQGDDYPSHPDLSHRIVSIKAAGPSTSVSHQWTLEEARELHRLLGRVFRPTPSDPSGIVEGRARALLAAGGCGDVPAGSALPGVRLADLNEGSGR